MKVFRGIANFLAGIGFILLGLYIGLSFPLFGILVLHCDKSPVLLKYSLIPGILLWTIFIFGAIIKEMCKMGATIIDSFKK